MSNNPRKLGARIRAQRLQLLALVALAMGALGACGGPNQKAGREQDRVAATAAGLNLTGEGPNERLGEAQDRVENADRKAKEAAARALQARGEQLRKGADVEADKLDAQDQAVRDAKP